MRKPWKALDKLALKHAKDYNLIKNKDGTYQLPKLFINVSIRDISKSLWNNNMVEKVNNKWKIKDFFARANFQK